MDRGTPGGVPGDSAGQRGVDIRQLFEDREFENELLEFIAGRMDPGPPRGAESPAHTDTAPPAYQTNLL